MTIQKREDPASGSLTLPSYEPSESNLFVLANLSTGKTIVDRLERPKTWLGRTRGLLGRRALDAGEGLWLERCWGIHTVGMRFPLDVLFLDDDLKVVGFEHGARPGRLAIMNAKAKHVVEMPEGTLKTADLLLGDRVRLFEA
jgi:uncharacterized membrane protein (UPF0127 family)